MRLRVARKMDRRPAHIVRKGNPRKDKRKWWTVYTVDQFLAAKRRLNRSWRTHRTSEPFVHHDGRPDRMLSVTPDFFAMNRVESCRIRKAVINRCRREGT